MLVGKGLGEIVVGEGTLGPGPPRMAKTRGESVDSKTKVSLYIVKA
jgi:hypothetical protein